MPTETIERQDIHETIDMLSDSALVKLAPYIAFLRYEDETPNAETIAAMKDAEAGIGETVTLEEIRARCDALR
jgi:hypothetical protein